MPIALPSYPSACWLLATTLVATLGVMAAPALASDASPCAGATATAISLAAVADREMPEVAHLWGKENLTLLPGDTAAPSGIAAVASPAGRSATADPPCAAD